MPWFQWVERHGRLWPSIVYLPVTYSDGRKPKPPVESHEITNFEAHQGIEFLTEMFPKPQREDDLNGNEG